MLSLTHLHEASTCFTRRPVPLIPLATPRCLANNASAPYKFAYARTALKYGLQAAGLQPGEAILVPEFICESFLDPLQELMITPSYYPVSWQLTPEWEILERLVTPKTKGLLAVHYFGIPQPIDPYLQFCAKHNLLLIEDNAHGFGATYAGQPLGTFGAIGVSSPRKSFPIYNGAFLHLAPPLTLSPSPALRLQPCPSFSARQKLKKLLTQLPLLNALCALRTCRLRHQTPPPPYDSQEAFRDPPLAHDYGMDADIEAYLAAQDIDYLKAIRQEIYAIWQSWAVKKGFQPLFPSLNEGAIPLVFPALVTDQKQWRQWFLRGHRHGIDIHSWPTLPRKIVAQNGNAMDIWRHLVCFPIHQNMDIQLLKKRISQI